MFNQYPYLNLNDLNLDYLLNEIKSMYNDVTNFVSINAIKYADPIQWNITSQYEKNTVVIDPLTGTAYISVAAVPSGVALTRTEYWTVVFDLGSFVTRAAQNFTSRCESDTTLTATFPTNTGEWLVWGDVLYKALTNITAGDAYVVGSNIEHFTIEDLYNTYLNTIAQILAMIGDLDSLTSSNKDSIVEAINSVITDFDAKIGDLSALTTTNKDNLVDAINEVSDNVNNLFASTISGHLYSKFTVPSGATYRNLSGACIVNGNYVAAFNTVGDNTKSTIVEMDIYGNVLRSAELTIYHANSIDYHDGKLYIATSVQPNAIVVVDYASLSFERYIQLSMEIASAKWFNDVLYVWTGTGSVYELDVDTSATTFKFNVDVTNMTLQDMAIDADYFYFLTVTGTNILVYTHDGNYVNLIQIPAQVGVYTIGEPENLSIYNGKFYLGNLLYENPQVPIVTAELYEISLKQSNNLYDNALRLTADGYGVVLYVNSNYTGVSDGTQNKPFKTIPEAINASRYYNKGLFIYLASGTYDSLYIHDIMCRFQAQSSGVIVHSCNAFNSILAFDGIEFDGIVQYGSIYAVESELRIRNCTFSGADVANYIALSGSRLSLIGCTFSGSYTGKAILATAGSFVHVNQKMPYKSVRLLEGSVANAFTLEPSGVTTSYEVGDIYSKMIGMERAGAYGNLYYGDYSLNIDPAMFSKIYLYLYVHGGRFTITQLTHVPSYTSPLTFVISKSYVKNDVLYDAFMAIRLDWSTHTLTIVDNYNYNHSTGTITHKSDNTATDEFIYLSFVGVE